MSYFILAVPIRKLFTKTLVHEFYISYSLAILNGTSFSSLGENGNKIWKQSAVKLNSKLKAHFHTTGHFQPTAHFYASAHFHRTGHFHTTNHFQAMLSYYTARYFDIIGRFLAT